MDDKYFIENCKVDRCESVLCDIDFESKPGFIDFDSINVAIKLKSKSAYPIQFMKSSRIVELIGELENFIIKCGFSKYAENETPQRGYDSYFLIDFKNKKYTIRTFNSYNVQLAKKYLKTTMHFILPSTLENVVKTNRWFYLGTKFGI